MTIRHFLDISTANISPATAKWLADAACTEAHIYATDGGWFVWAGQCQMDMPPDLAAVLGYAKGKGCDYVMFDADADEIDGLPTFDW